MIVAIVNGDERIENVQNVRINEDELAIIEYIDEEYGSTCFTTPINKLELIKEDPIKMEQYFRDCDYLKEEKYDMCFQCYRYNTCIKDYEKAKKRGFKK